MMKYYRSSILSTIIALALGFWLGGLMGGLVVVAILSVLEISVSFDNAVFNASILKNWDKKWRDRFIIYGLPVAVFGMRFAFPIAIVCFAASLNPWAALKLAVNDPSQYKVILTSVHHEVAAFGGAFLMMVFLKFFLDANKDHHWISVIEKPLSRIGHLDMVEACITLGVVVTASYYIATEEQVSFLLAGIFGLITYIVAEGLGSLIGGEESGGDVTTQIVKQGWAGLMYLELADASFSFDGVIGAFAITSDIFIMMIGLSVGAMFVRSMTLHLVDKGTLATFVYLEHSAFWAIGVLAFIMFAGVVTDIPEVFTGMIGAAVILAGVYHSWIELKRNKSAVPATV
jgi:hypothetical protein